MVSIGRVGPPGAVETGMLARALAEVEVEAVVA